MNTNFTKNKFFTILQTNFLQFYKFLKPIYFLLFEKFSKLKTFQKFSFSILVFLILTLLSFSTETTYEITDLNGSAKNNKNSDLLIKQRQEGLYEAGVFLVKKYEGLYLMPYICPAGIPTIGWGHTFDYYEVGKGKNKQVFLTKAGKEELKKYRNGISFREAQEIFRNEYLQNLERTKNKLGNIQEKKHLLALTSVTYNAGQGGMYSKGTAPGKSYKNGDSEETVSEKIKNRFRTNTTFVKGIKKRRNEESKLFSSEYDSILAISKNWKSEVTEEIQKVLPLYGLDKQMTNRQTMKPFKRRAKCEMTQEQIDQLLKN